MHAVDVYNIRIIYVVKRSTHTHSQSVSQSRKIIPTLWMPAKFETNEFGIDSVDVFMKTHHTDSRDEKRTNINPLILCTWITGV